MTLYQITDEAVKINELFENAVDENGEPRELTQDEKDTLGKWILEIVLKILNGARLITI